MPALPASAFVSTRLDEILRATAAMDLPPDVTCVRHGDGTCVHLRGGVVCRPLHLGPAVEFADGTGIWIDLDRHGRIDQINDVPARSLAEAMAQQEATYATSFHDDVEGLAVPSPA